MVLSNSQYDAIMREYSSKQNKARRELDLRTSEVYRDVPEYKELADRVSTISVNAAKAALLGQSRDSVTLKDELSKLDYEMQETLVRAGYPKDYLTPKYECSLCQDTGYCGNEKCSCFRQASIDLLYRQSNIKDILSTENFNNFSLKYYSKNVVDSATCLTPYDNAARVLQHCKDFVSNFPSGDNILFYGDTGVGKTFLSHCIAKELLDEAHSVLYLSAIELFQYFSNYGDSDYGYESENPEQHITDCDLLIIDDLGTELSNSFTNSKLFYCVNSRIQNGKSTIISTNFSLKELMNNYSERIFSRISSSYKLLKLVGDDIRLIKK